MLRWPAAEASAEASERCAGLDPLPARTLTRLALQNSILFYVLGNKSHDVNNVMERRGRLGTALL